MPQDTRFFRVVNATNKPLKIFIRYETEIADGEFQWYPDKQKQPVSLQLAPNEDVDIFDGNWGVHASQVFVWAETDGKKWSQFKDKTLLLVPEVDADGKHIYEAPVRDVFTYTFR